MRRGFTTIIAITMLALLLVIAISALLIFFKDYTDAQRTCAKILDFRDDKITLFNCGLNNITDFTVRFGETEVGIYEEDRLIEPGKNRKFRLWFLPHEGTHMFEIFTEPFFRVLGSYYMRRGWVIDVDTSIKSVGGKFQRVINGTIYLNDGSGRVYDNSLYGYQLDNNVEEIAFTDSLGRFNFTTDWVFDALYPGMVWKVSIKDRLASDHVLLEPPSIIDFITHSNVTEYPKFDQTGIDRVVGWKDVVPTQLTLKHINLTFNQTLETRNANLQPGEHIVYTAAFFTDQDVQLFCGNEAGIPCNTNRTSVFINITNNYTARSWSTTVLPNTGESEYMDFNITIVNNGSTTIVTRPSIILSNYTFHLNPSSSPVSILDELEGISVGSYQEIAPFSKMIWPYRLHLNELRDKKMKIFSNDNLSDVFVLDVWADVQGVSNSRYATQVEFFGLNSSDEIFNHTFYYYQVAVQLPFQPIPVEKCHEVPVLLNQILLIPCGYQDHPHTVITWNFTSLNDYHTYNFSYIAQFDRNETLTKHITASPDTLYYVNSVNKSVNRMIRASTGMVRKNASLETGFTISIPNQTESIFYYALGTITNISSLWTDVVINTYVANVDYAASQKIDNVTVFSGRGERKVCHQTLTSPGNVNCDLVENPSPNETVIENKIRHAIEGFSINMSYSIGDNNLTRYCNLTMAGILDPIHCGAFTGCTERACSFRRLSQYAYANETGRIETSSDKYKSRSTVFIHDFLLGTKPTVTIDLWNWYFQAFPFWNNAEEHNVKIRTLDNKGFFAGYRELTV